MKEDITSDHSVRQSIKRRAFVCAARFPYPDVFFALLILLLSFHRWLKIWRSIWRFAMQFLCISLLFFSISALRGHRARVFTFLFSGVNISLYQKGSFGSPSFSSTFEYF